MASKQNPTVAMAAFYLRKYDMTDIEKEIITNLTAHKVLDIGRLTKMSEITEHESRIGTAIRSLEDKRLVAQSRVGHNLYKIVVHANG